MRMHLTAFVEIVLSFVRVGGVAVAHIMHKTIVSLFVNICSNHFGFRYTLDKLFKFSGVFNTFLQILPFDLTFQMPRVTFLASAGTAFKISLNRIEC